MKVGIIGAGITGLTVAYELGKRNISAEVYEEAPQVGGIAGVNHIDGVALEKYYHHYFKSDWYVMRLLRELGISDRMIGYPSTMGYFCGGQAYDFGTPVSLMRFDPLRFSDKLRFGRSVMKLMMTKDYGKLEDITAHDWIRTNVGSEVYNKIWRPMLITKFGSNYKDISMAWLWGKIKLRGSSKERGREVLGYIEGSNEVMLKKLCQEIGAKGGKVHLNRKVASIEMNADKFLLRTTSRELVLYDKLVCTTPLPVFLDLAKKILPADYVKEKKQIDYTSVLCSTFILDRPFSKYYWLNIGDENIPFGGLIEHTNLIGRDAFKGKSILYTSNYLCKDSSYYNMNDEQIIEAYVPFLKKVNRQFDKSWIQDIITFRDQYAQPIIKKGYSRIKPGFETPIAGLYTASMCNIYPEDRGVNYAIRDGIEVSKLI